MNTVVNGGAIVEECLLNGGRDVSLSAINGSIDSNEESTSPPLYVETRLLYNCRSHSKVQHSMTFHTLGDLKAKSFKAKFYLETDFWKWITTTCNWFDNFILCTVKSKFQHVSFRSIFGFSDCLWRKIFILIYCNLLTKSWFPNQ